jgi:aspartyl-tRNA(Asn)/glutamyl-tRNA(Gln) amidotransferase subunit B
MVLSVCSGNMEEGSFRCDANVSVMEKGATKLGTRTELKNINSFRFVREALELEIARQVEIVEGGGAVEQETRLYDPEAKRTRSMRSKEEAHDYRYFPDPDLLPLSVSPEWIEQIRRALPELPRARVERFERQYALPHEDARAIAGDADRAVGDFFEAVAARHKDARRVANWFRGELFRTLKEGARLADLKLTTEALAGLLSLVEQGAISGNAAKEVFAELVERGGDPAQIVERKGLRQVSDTGAIEKAVDEVLAAHPDEAARFRGGKRQLLAFFTGQVMKAMRGKGNPAVVSELVKKKLGG